MSETQCDICFVEDTASVQSPVAVVCCLDCKQNICKKCCAYHVMYNGDSSHRLVRKCDSMGDKEISKCQTVCCDKMYTQSVGLQCCVCKTVNCISCFMDRHYSHNGAGMHHVVQKFCDEIEQRKQRRDQHKTDKFLVEDVKNEPCHSYTSIDKVQLIGERLKFYIDDALSELSNGFDALHCQYCEKSSERYAALGPIDECLPDVANVEASGIPDSCSLCQLKSHTILKLDPVSRNATELDTFNTPGHAELDTSNTLGHAELDTSNTPGHAELDISNTLGHAELDTSNTPDHAGQMVGAFNEVPQLSTTHLVKAADLEDVDMDRVVFFQQHAELYRYTDDIWKWCGAGYLSIVRNFKTDDFFMLMMDDKTMQECLHRQIMGNATLGVVPDSDNCEVMWIDTECDQTQGSLYDMYSVCFANKQTAYSFRQTFEYVNDILQAVCRSHSSLLTVSSSAMHMPVTAASSAESDMECCPTTDTGMSQSHDKSSSHSLSNTHSTLANSSVINISLSSSESNPLLLSSFASSQTVSLNSLRFAMTTLSFSKPAVSQLSPASSLSISPSCPVTKQFQFVTNCPGVSSSPKCTIPTTPTCSSSVSVVTFSASSSSCSATAWPTFSIGHLFPFTSLSSISGTVRLSATSSKKSTAIACTSSCLIYTSATSHASPSVIYPFFAVSSSASNSTSFVISSTCSPFTSVTSSKFNIACTSSHVPTSTTRSKLSAGPLPEKNSKPNLGSSSITSSKFTSVFTVGSASTALAASKIVTLPEFCAVASSSKVDHSVPYTSPKYFAFSVSSVSSAATRNAAFTSPSSTTAKTHAPVHRPSFSATTPRMSAASSSINITPFNKAKTLTFSSSVLPTYASVTPTSMGSLFSVPLKLSAGSSVSSRTSTATRDSVVSFVSSTTKVCTSSTYPVFSPVSSSSRPIWPFTIAATQGVFHFGQSSNSECVIPSVFNR